MSLESSTVPEALPTEVFSVLFFGRPLASRPDLVRQDAHSMRELGNIARNGREGSWRGTQDEACGGLEGHREGIVRPAERTDKRPEPDFQTRATPKSATTLLASLIDYWRISHQV